MAAGGLALATRSAEETMQVGFRLGEMLPGGAVVGLTGGLGAGKTTFARGLFAGLGASEHVVSPTFILIREIGGRVPLVHIDLYRLEKEEEMVGIGVPDYLAGEGVAVVEWCERLGTLSPAEWLVVRLAQGPGLEDRQIAFEPHGGRWEALLAGAWPALASAASGRSRG